MSKAKDTGKVKENPAPGNDNPRMSTTRQGIKFLLIGLLVMVSGYILMIGGGSDDPAVFNYAMFDFRRTVAAPIVILCGVVIEVVAIMRVGKGPKEEK